MQDDCEFPFSQMAACGLVFFLLVALRKALRERGVFERIAEPDLRGYLDLVGLGTIADMVPLVEQNRLFAKLGVEELQRTTRPGIAALREVSNLTGKVIDGSSVGFDLAPRLNAAGRLGSARRAVDLLIAPEADSARLLAEEVDRENKSRRDVQKATFEAAVRLVESSPGCCDAPALVLSGDSWHAGVVGIVASKLVERFQRPVLLIAMNEQGLGRGSGRSVPGVDLFHALSRCAPLLEAYGGHSLAGGVTVRRENLEAFREAFLGEIEKTALAGIPPVEVKVDGVIALGQVDRSLLAEIAKIGPYGSGFRAPMFLVQAVRAAVVRVVGRDHLQMQLQDGSAERSAIAFGQAHHKPERGQLLDVVFRPEIEVFRGRENLRLRVEDFRPHPG